mmetsp:Transcript_45139/g.137714  ORF Transcript_45139/g.137714 Transcript_45139/m.137714 type:complete len:97 (+) Transcript_45139:228-518(+)
MAVDILGLIVSVCLNGICCLHSMQAEEEKQEKIHEEMRKSILVEYERQRLFDRECQERIMDDIIRSEQVDEQKRRLMMAKHQQSAVVLISTTDQVQ